MKKTKEYFLNCTIKDISQMYQGERDCCRCGCRGNYWATSYMKDTRRDVDDKKVARCLRRAKKLVSSGCEFEIEETYIDVKTGNNRSLTFYFD